MNYKNRLSPLLVGILTLLSMNVYSQSAPILMDGLFNDWDASLSTFTDASETIAGIDILDMQVTNDDDFLFVSFNLDTEIDLHDALVNHDLFLYIDADNNSSTGYSAQSGFGSELGIDMKDKIVHYNVTPYVTVGLSDIQFRSFPTVTSTTFEIAIGRNVIPDGIHPLFPEDTIRVLIKENVGGDEMPNVGSSFTYIFDDTPITPIDLTDFGKVDTNFIRVVGYNVEQNGLNVVSRQDNFENMIVAMDPDIIAFSECSSTSALQVKTLMDAWIPLGTVDGWYVEKDDYDLVTASCFPIISQWTAPNRFYPVLIDLPPNYTHDLMVINGHLSCCANDAGRQAQADEFAEFILDAKSIGGMVDLPVNTPFVLTGDLNLVGWAQQLQTLVTGDIQDTGTYGAGGALDWDNTELTDQYCRQTDKRTTYTWRSDGGSYPPGRLDFMIYSDAAMNAEKAFCIQTSVMSASRLAAVGLSSNDATDASDHFPVVTDFAIPMLELVDTDMDGWYDEIDNCPEQANADQADWNNNGVGDVCEDSDMDGLLDGEEIVIFGTNPAMQDSDLDGLTDGLEVNDSLTNPMVMDTDGDGCLDNEEYAQLCGNTSSCLEDLNNDGFVNAADLLQFLGAFGSTCQ